ncbi:hypothetical protein GN956_G19323 [Arapaima gigas]
MSWHTYRAASRASRGGATAAVSVYRERKGNDSELRGMSVKKRIAADSRLKSHSDMVLRGALGPGHGAELRWSQDSPTPAEGACVALPTQGCAGTLMDKVQAGVEIGPCDLDEQWRSSRGDEDTWATQIAEDEIYLSQRFPESSSAGFVLTCGYIAEATAAPGMAGVSLWEMAVEYDGRRRVAVCTLDEIFRVAEYSDVVEKTQPSEVRNSVPTVMAKHTRFLAGEDCGTAKLSGYSDEPPALYSVCLNTQDNSEIPNIAVLPEPCRWEAAQPSDLTSGDRRQSDKNLQGKPHKMRNESVGLDSGLTFEEGSLETMSFGGPSQELIFHSKQNESVREVRELSRRLSTMIMLTGDRLMVSKEARVAYFTLDLHSTSDYTASHCEADANCHRLEKTEGGTGDKKKAGMAPHRSETYVDCELVPGRQPGIDLGSCADETWEAEKRTTEQGDRASSDPPLASTLLTASAGKEKQFTTATKAAVESKVAKSCREDKRKRSSVQVKSVRLGTAEENPQSSCRNKDRLQPEISTWQNKSLCGFPVRNKRDEVSGVVVPKKPCGDVGEDHLCRKKGVPGILREIWAERDRSASRGLRLQCLLGHVTEDCAIVWSKDGNVLAEDKGSTADARQISLSIARASKMDLGMYRCLLTSPHGQTFSEYHLTAAEEMKEVKEDVKCARLLFREDFLREQYFGRHEAASIVTEGVHFGEGMHRRAFRTRLVGGMDWTDFRPGQSCVLKVHNSVSYGTRNNEELVCRNYNLAAEECFIQNTAREYIKAYREVARAAETFGEVPEIIPIYLVHRPSNEIPYATLEEELMGDFVKYSVRDGREVNLTRRESEAGQKCCAFQHWVYHKTEGNLLVTDMQGRVGMKLTDVGIATCRKGYRGFRGNCAASFIDQFRALHQCNRFCLLLGLQSLKAEHPKPMRMGNEPKPKKKTLTSTVKKKL